MDFSDASQRERLEKLAKELNTPEGLAIARQLQAVGLLGIGNHQQSNEPAPKHSSQVSKAQAISIWQPVWEQGHLLFRRPKPGPFDDHFAKTTQFRAEKPPACKRVAFFGESVAAGYLLAPHVTPAQMLQKFTQQCWPEEKLEILDFSRTNETLSGMIQLAEASLQVDPDVMIFFAGNNWTLMEMPEWSPFLPSVRVRQRLGDLWRKGGLAEVKQDELSRLTQAVGRKLNALGEWLKTRGLPAIWLLPEVNLKDWDHLQPPPCLEGNKIGFWYEAFQEALDAWERGALEEVSSLAWRLLDLDAGTSPVGYRFLGMALLGQGKADLAREAFRYEVQASGYSGSCFLGAPQMTPHLEKIVEGFAHRYGVILVRLSEVFREASPESVVGRDYFYDYCHLSAQGMKLAMSEVLQPLKRLLEFDQEPLPIAELAYEIPARVEAVACIGAAIHSCHRQIPVLIRETPWRYWLERAVELDPTVIRFFSLYIMARAGHAPLVFSQVQGEMLAEEAPLTPQHGWFYEYLDASIVQEMLQVMQNGYPELYEASLAFLLEKRAIGSEPVSLTENGFYLWMPLARYIPDALNHSRLSQRALLRCPWPQISFAFVSRTQKPLQVELTVRLPEEAQPEAFEKTRILLNREPIHELEVSKKWGVYRVFLAPEMLQRGINNLMLQFPVNSDPSFDSRIYRDFQLGKETSFHPLFAEIWDISLAEV